MQEDLIDDEQASNYKPLGTQNQFDDVQKQPENVGIIKRESESRMHTRHGGRRSDQNYAKLANPVIEPNPSSSKKYRPYKSKSGRPSISKKTQGQVQKLGFGDAESEEDNNQQMKDDEKLSEDGNGDLSQNSNQQSRNSNN